MFTTLKVVCINYLMEDSNQLIAQVQHFSLYHSQTIDFTDIFTDSKSVSNSDFLPLLIFDKTDRKRGRNEKKLLCKISKIHEECLQH